jgi:hypothetical protein
MWKYMKKINAQCFNMLKSGFESNDGSAFYDACLLSTTIFFYNKQSTSSWWASLHELAILKITQK